MLRFLISLCRNDSGATAATIALCLAALIGAGGIAFDYARMAGLHTELQSAADQAALAAAGQLDGRDGAISRATQAAQSLIQNQTRFANDGGGAGVTIPTIIFYSAYQEGTGPSNVTTTDSEANIVRVTVGARTANYALTPIVGAFSSGQLSASALAGLGKAICNTPPVMICNPQEPISNTDLKYSFTAPPGTGLLLTAGSPDSPGNFGFLETGIGSGASNLARALGHDRVPGQCVRTDTLTTKPGLNASVIGALNTRFDITANGNQSCPSGGTCSPSSNVRKDLVHRSGQCGTTGGGWRFEPSLSYLPATNAVLTSNYPRVMGHPRDICHTGGSMWSCPSGRVGNGSWDRNAYFQSNYPAIAASWATVTGLGSAPTRYQVYMWEIANRALLTARDGTPAFPNPLQNLRTDSAPACGIAGVTPSATVVDRRRISVAVVNCRANQIRGSTASVPVVRNLDLFLVEPSFNRTDSAGRTRSSDSEMYVEVIGTTGSAGTDGSAGGTAQMVRRDVPRLLE
jgi:Flp pilus assembly protein TadG